MQLSALVDPHKKIARDGVVSCLPPRRVVAALVDRVAVVFLADFGRECERAVRRVGGDAVWSGDGAGKVRRVGMHGAVAGGGSVAPPKQDRGHVGR